MNTPRFLTLLHGLLLTACTVLLPALQAQDAASAGKSALTYDRHPYSFDSSNPLKPESAVLLRFNVPVNPDAVEGGLRLYDQPNDRFAAVSAKRPTLEEIGRFIESPAAEIALDHFVIIRPASRFPLVAPGSSMRPRALPRRTAP